MMKLHEVLKEAMAYFEMCEADSNISIDMTHWHEWLNEEKTLCSVCLAGAYLCKGIINPELSMCDMRVNGGIHIAIDELRCGNVSAALRFMGVEPPKSGTDFEVCPYKEDAFQFKRDMNRILDWLTKNDY